LKIRGNANDIILIFGVQNKASPERRMSQFQMGWLVMVAKAPLNRSMVQSNVNSYLTPI